MSESALFSLVVGLVFLAGAAAGWRIRRSDRSQPARIGDDELLTLTVRNEMLRVSARAAHQRAAAAEIDLAAALAATAHLEVEVDRLSRAAEEALAEAESASAWVRKVWRERAIGQGAPGRHPSAQREERTVPPESVPRPIAMVRDGVPSGRTPGRAEDRARWN